MPWCLAHQLFLAHFGYEVEELGYLEREAQIPRPSPESEAALEAAHACGQAALRSLALLQQQRKDTRQRLSQQLGKCRQMQGKVKDAEGQQALLLERLRPLQPLLERGKHVSSAS